MDTIKIYTNVLLRKENFNPTLWNKVKTKDDFIYYAVINGVRVHYHCNKFLLTLECSVTKLLYGSNTLTFNPHNTYELFNKLNSILKILINKPMLSVCHWTITRLDLAYNFICANKEDKMTYLNAFKNLPFYRSKNNLHSSIKESIHYSNKSITYNIYSKSHETIDADNRILRLEIQLKNSTLHNLHKSKKITSKTFEEVLTDVNTLNKIYNSYLKKLGLDKKFLTKKEFISFLKKLKKRGIISNRIYKNMYCYFIYNSNPITKSTFNKYKKILNANGISHILLDKPVTKKIKFIKTDLFKEKIILTLYSKPSILLESLKDMTNLLIFLIVFYNIVIKSISIFDDS